MPKLLSIVMLLACVAVSSAFAQESADEKAARTHSTYRLDFSFNELEDGKKVNTRSYTMILQDTPENPNFNAWSNRTSMKVVTRVPVTTDNKGVITTVYIDVGLSITSRLRPHGGTTDIDGNVELSSLAQPDQAASGRPVFRTVESNFGAEITLGKPMLIASMDDLSSTRRYEVEVTATKLK